MKTLFLFNLIAIFTLSLFSQSASANEFGDLFSKISDHTGKSVGCVDSLLVGSQSDYNTCLNAMRRTEKILLRLKSSDAVKFAYFTGVTFTLPYAQTKSMKDLRKTNGSGEVFFPLDDTDETIETALKANLNNFNRLNAKLNSFHLNKTSYSSVDLQCDQTISFSDCEFGLGTLKKILKNQDALKREIISKVDILCISDRSEGDANGFGIVNLRYLRKSAYMLSELKQALTTVR